MSGFAEQYAAQEQTALAALVGHPQVTLGEPVVLTPEEQSFGHMNCRFHLVETETGEDVDGGSASMLIGYLRDGTYGQGPFTLQPVQR